MLDGSTNAPDRVNTVQDIAARLHVHQQTVRKWIRSGELGHVSVGPGTVRVTDSQLAAFIDARTVDADAC